MSEPSTPTHSAPPSPSTPVTPAAQATPTEPPPLHHVGGGHAAEAPEAVESIPILWFGLVPQTPGRMPVVPGGARRSLNFDD